MESEECLETEQTKQELTETTVNGEEKAPTSQEKSNDSREQEGVEEDNDSVQVKQEQQQTDDISNSIAKVNPIQPLATTRKRRANAGNLMGHLIQDEEDDFYCNLYGGFYEEEDDKDFNDNQEVGADDDEDDVDSDFSIDENENVEAELEVVKQEPKKQNKKDSKNAKSKAKKKARPTSSKRDLRPSTSTTSYLNVNLESPSQSAYKSCAKICSVCLGKQSDEDDEIIECDACGVSVHEACYGAIGQDDNADSHSVRSGLSSQSTEPWFCEPCKRSVTNPVCELCPNLGGIFKRTDTGRWVHMVCALYTRGVTFENVDTLSNVSLFELNYALYGSKACAICEDRRLARTGICIGCDAGMCKTFFHATCAQKEGFLFELHSDEIDPYIAQCKQHADKTVIKEKRRTCTALFARLSKLKPLESCSALIKDKLKEVISLPDPHMTRWNLDNMPPITHKSSRMLMTSPSLILKLTKKSELMGLDPKSAFMAVQDEMEMARPKWHIPPAFSLEFVAYCRDRTSRMASMKRQNIDLTNQNSALKTEEATLRDKYNGLKELVNVLRTEIEGLIQEARDVQKSASTASGKQFPLPIQIDQLVARFTNVKSKQSFSKTSAAVKNTNTTYCCAKCATQKDQHLLSLCDTCNSYLHIYCLDPPLTRVPKKTKFGGWQCSDCAERDDEEQEEAIEEQQEIAVQEAEQDGPRRLRERIKFPDKYCHESMMADFWSVNKKRPTKRPTKPGASKTKKIKVESS